MAAYFPEEYFNMVRLYFENGSSGARAAAVYAEAYPNAIRHPDANVINRAVRRLCETGNVMLVGAGGRPRTVRNPELEERVLEMVREDPRTSTREIARSVGVSHVIVHKVLKEQKLHPYHFTRVQRLLPRDYLNRFNFSRQLLRRCENEEDFLRRILWTDECTFAQDGYFNFHNYHYYGEENPHLTWDGNSQYRYTINVWAGMINNELIGPIFLPERLNAVNYYEFLRDELPEILFPPNEIDDMPLIRRRIIFMHDGCPAHSARNVTQYLNRTYGEDWMGLRATTWKWPARSPDLNPCDFFLWGAVKEAVYFNRPETVEDLQACIQVAFADIKCQHILRATQSVRRRAMACVEMNGGQFQHLL